MIYFTSDNHWGHKSVIHMSNRPFDNVEQMNQFMIDRWNSVVKPNDDVYHLGDLMYKMNPNQFVKRILNVLNGNIYLLVGNHDERYLKKYMDRLVWAKDRHQLKYKYEEKEYNFILDHYPLYSWKGLWRKYIHLHGHTHHNTSDLDLSSFGFSMNVNCEFFEYKPISIIEIIKTFKDKHLEKNIKKYKKS